MEIKIYRGLPQESKQIRQEVFVDEQGFCDEYDEIDDIAYHIVLFDDVAVATCRIYEKETPGIFMFGRLAVKKHLRKNGIGSKTVKAAEDYVISKGGKSIVLHAQLHAKDFYKKLGYVEFGEIDYEQDSPHIWMRKDLV